MRKDKDCVIQMKDTSLRLLRSSAELGARVATQISGSGTNNEPINGGKLRETEGQRRWTSAQPRKAFEDCPEKAH